MHEKKCCLLEILSHQIQEVTDTPAKNQEVMHSRTCYTTIFLIVDVSKNILMTFLKHFLLDYK